MELVVVLQKSLVQNMCFLNVQTLLGPRHKRNHTTEAGNAAHCGELPKPHHHYEIKLHELWVFVEFLLVKGFG